MMFYRGQQSGGGHAEQGARFMTESIRTQLDANDCSSENPLPRKKSPTPASPPSKLGAENTELDALLSVSQPNSLQSDRGGVSDEFTESFRSIAAAAQHMNRTSIADQFLAQFESRNNSKHSARGAAPLERPRDSVLNSIDLNNNLTNVSSLVIPDMASVNGRSSQQQQQQQKQHQHQPSVDEEDGNATFTVIPSDKTRLYCEKIMMDAAKQMTNEFERNYLEYQKAQQTLLNEEKTRHHAEIVKLQREMKLMYERMKQCELKSDRKDAEIRNLEKLLELQQKRNEAQILFLRWRLKAVRASSESLANRMATYSHESRLKTWVLLAWQKKMSRIKEVRAEKTIRKKAQDALQSLANTYETKLKKYQEDFERKESEFKRFKKDRVQREEKLRGLITRYLVNLNQEALSMFDQTDTYKASPPSSGQNVHSPLRNNETARKPATNGSRQPLNPDEFASLYHHFQSSEAASTGQSAPMRKPHRDKDPHYSDEAEEESSARRKAPVAKPPSTERRPNQETVRSKPADQQHEPRRPSQNMPITVTPLSSRALELSQETDPPPRTQKITNQLPPSGYQQSQASANRQNPASAITNITKNFANVNVSTLKNNSQLVQERSIFVQKHTS